MSFAGLLGAGLLGGAGNAAKGIGDRLREEAKAKRVMALQESANAQAKQVAKTANDNAVTAARERRVFDGQQNDLTRAATLAGQNNAGYIAATAATVANGRGVVNNETATGVAADVAALQNDNVVTNAATATGVAADVAALQNDNVVTNAATATGVAETVAAQAHADAMEVAGIQTGSKATTSKQARAYFTSQAKFLIGGSSNKYGIKEGLTDADGVVVKKWINDAMAQFNKTGNMADISSIVNTIFVKPFNEKNVVVMDVDYRAAKTESNESDDSWFGADENVVDNLARTKAIARERAYFDAREAIRLGADRDAVMERLKESGIDVSLF